MTSKKTARLRLFAAALGLFTLFWWPASHWFYPDWYHDLMGFESYDLGFVRLIGTMGLLPVTGLFWTAWRPRESRGFLIAFAVWAAGLAATYVFLILNGDFPPAEYANAGLLMIVVVVVLALLPDPAPNPEE